MATTTTKGCYVTPTSQFDEDTFRAHSKWLAFEQNSLNWPKYWRAVIFRISREIDPNTGVEVYRVLPRNPDYDRWAEISEIPPPRGKLMSVGFGTVKMDTDTGDLIPAPPMHLPVAEFSSMAEIDQWAQVAWRIK